MGKATPGETDIGREPNQNQQQAALHHAHTQIQKVNPGEYLKRTVLGGSDYDQNRRQQQNRGQLPGKQSNPTA